jgi:hypothetical protein
VYERNFAVYQKLYKNNRAMFRELNQEMA